MDIELRRTFELTAVLHVTKLPRRAHPADGRAAQLRRVRLHGHDGGFDLQPPTELNVASGWPVVRENGATTGEPGVRRFPHALRHGSAASEPRNREEARHRRSRASMPTPEPSPTATPVPSAAGGLGDADPGQSRTPAGKKPRPARPPRRSRQKIRHAGLPRAVAGHADPAQAVVKATGDQRRRLAPALPRRHRRRPPRPGRRRAPAQVADTTKNGRCMRRASNRPAGNCGRVRWPRSANTAD